jgi:hypothetical protein
VESPRKGNLEDVNIEWRIILKIILKKYRMEGCRVDSAVSR